MSDILAREQLQAVERWQAPEVTSSDASTSESRRRPASVYSARALEDLQKRAWNEAWAEGIEAGRQAGLAEMRDRGEALKVLMDAMARPLQAIDEEVETELAQLAVAIARQIIRRELRTEPEHVIGAVREALEALPSGSRNVRVHLHPEDADLVRQALSNPAGETAWELREDPVLDRGGCRVTTDAASVDGTLETRLATVAARVLGGLRDEDGGIEDDAP